MKNQTPIVQPIHHQSKKLNCAIQLIKSGNKSAALPILKEIIQADPNTENAWLWLFSCVEKVEQKKYCLQQALRINPNNQNIHRELVKLENQAPIIQPIHHQSEKLGYAIQLIKSGNKPAALPILKKITRTDPNAESAWLWLFTCVEKVEYKKYCLQQALRINPNNLNAHRELVKLENQISAIMPPIHHQVEPLFANSLVERTVKEKNQSIKPYTAIGKVSGAGYTQRTGISKTPSKRTMTGTAGRSGYSQVARVTILDSLQTMLHFLFMKSLRMITILLGVTLITFLLIHAIPGNPWSNYSNAPRMFPNMSFDKSMQNELNRRFGLDLPLWRQFTRYIIGDFNQHGSFFCGAVCGNLGPSIQQRRSVQSVLFGPPKGKTFWESRCGYSIRLVLFGSLIAVGLGIPLGILIATKPKSAVNRAISVGLAGLVSVPNFVLGLLVIIVMASWLKIINVLLDWGTPSNWIFPAVVLATIPMANIARVTRTSLMNILNEDYIRTARAKGMTQTRVMLVHVMRNALVPIITFLGPTLMEMLTGLLIVENLYSFPGMGRSYWEAVLVLDYPMILGLTLIYATCILFVNMLIDFLCENLDPRIRSIKHRGVP